MSEVSLFRLYLLRAVYLLIGATLVAQIGPKILMYHGQWELMEGVVQCMLVTFGLLCLLGLRYPLRMLPVLLWELGWKAAWLLVIALPQWRAGTLDGATAETAFACLVGIVVPLALPWRYLYERYVQAPGDRWGVRGAGARADAVQ